MPVPAGRLERLLARVALEWAAAAPEPVTDALYALRPSAWIAVRAGAADRLTDAVLLHGAGPRLVLDTDVPPEAPFGPASEAEHIEVALCEDFEDEAQCSAAQVLALLGAQRAPVALIALDRSLVRRVRALLERQGVSLLDETGWRLSTTRAGARLMALLRAMAPRASGDELLDWLKASAIDGPALHDRRSAGGALEAVLRRRGLTSVQALEPAAFEGRAAALLGEVQALREQFAAQHTRTLLEWRDALRELLERSGDAAALERDAAGLQALAALRLSDPAPAGGEIWSEVARATRMSGDEFARWVDAVLEQSSFIAAAPHAPEVVITPLSRAMLRPFAAVVCPAPTSAGSAPPRRRCRCSATRWRGTGPPTPRPAPRRASCCAFAQLLRAPRLILLRRRVDGGEPLAPSPLLERLALARGDAGRPRRHCRRRRERQPIIRRRTDRARRCRSPPRCCREPLSASACEALRACPYRFFALRLLRPARGRRARRRGREARLRHLAARGAASLPSRRARARCRVERTSGAPARHRRGEVAARRPRRGRLPAVRRDASSASRRATSRGCTSAMRGRALVATARSSSRRGPRRSAASRCTAASIASTRCVGDEAPASS